MLSTAGLDWKAKELFHGLMQLDLRRILLCDPRSDSHGSARSTEACRPSYCSAVEQSFAHTVLMLSSDTRQ